MAPVAPHTWYALFPILSWMIAGAEEARGTLEHVADELEGAADEARRMAYDYEASSAFAHGIARDRVAALRTEDPRPAAAPAPVAVLSPNRGVLVNAKRGLDLLLGSQPSKETMRSFTGRDPRPRWLANVQEAVDHAMCGLSRARSELEAVCSDVDDFFAVPTLSDSQGAAGVAQACAAAAHHARRGAANLGALVHILGKLHDELEDEPPTIRVRQFFGYVYVPPSPPIDDDSGAATQD